MENQEEIKITIDFDKHRISSSHYLRTPLSFALLEMPPYYDIVELYGYNNDDIFIVSRGTYLSHIDDTTYTLNSLMLDELMYECSDKDIHAMIKNDIKEKTINIYRTSAIIGDNKYVCTIAAEDELQAELILIDNRLNDFYNGDIEHVSVSHLFAEPHIVGEYMTHL